LTTTVDANNSSGFKVTADTSGILQLQTNGTAAVTVDASQNVGIGVTPSAWGSTTRAIELSATGPSYLAFNSTTNPYGYIYANAYYNGTNNIYKNNGYASVYSINNSGQHQWFNAASGTAGGIISFTQAMTLDASGNLGIGTSSPTQKLEVSGNIKLGSSGSTLIYGPATTGRSFFSNSDTTAYIGIYGSAYGSGQNSTIQLVTGTSNVVTLDASGNVGIGVTPSAWSGFVGSQIGPLGGMNLGGSIDDSFVGSNVYYNAGFKFARATTATYATMYRQTGGVHSWQTSTATGTAGNAITFTQAMTLDASGNLGVGTTSPSQKLHVNSAGAAIGIFQSTLAAGNTNVETRYISTNRTWAVGQNIIQTSSIFEIADVTASATRLAIDTSGNLLVGTTDANPNSGNGVKINAGTAARTSVVGSADTNANFALTVYSTSPAAYRFQVGYGGTIYATSTSITAISDASLKTNVRDLETGLTEVMALQPRRFDWINGDASNVAGFIAQEVKQVLPDLVEDYQYSDEETKLGLKMGDILPTLVKAIQEQQALITQLTTRLTALENK